jgi:hypothetical protein
MNNLTVYTHARISQFISPNEISNISQTSKLINQLYNNDFIWKIKCLNLNIKPPTKRAIKYKTWKSLYIKEYNKICKQCYINYHLKKIHCEPCINKNYERYLISDEYEDDKLCDIKITKTQAISNYYIKDSDFVNISYETAPNPYSRSSPAMKLYKLHDVKNIAYQINGGIEGVLSIYNQRIQKKQQRNNKVNLQRNTRRLQLLTELKKYNIRYRTDSELCNDYINSDRDDFDNIVQIMIEMNWLYKNTQYAEFIREAYQNTKYFDKYQLSKLAKNKSIRQWYKQHNYKITEEIPINIQKRITKLFPQI